jgi:hypothetical protein
MRRSRYAPCGKRTTLQPASSSARRPPSVSTFFQGWPHSSLSRLPDSPLSAFRSSLRVQIKLNQVPTACLGVSPCLSWCAGTLSCWSAGVSLCAESLSWCVRRPVLVCQGACLGVSGDLSWCADRPSSASDSPEPAASWMVANAATPRWKTDSPPMSALVSCRCAAPLRTAAHSPRTKSAFQRRVSTSVFHIPSAPFHRLPFFRRLPAANFPLTLRMHSLVSPPRSPNRRFLKTAQPTLQAEFQRATRVF